MTLFPEYYLNDEAATEDLGRRLASHCPVSAIIFLSGELGAGKTTLVRGFLSAFGYTGAVKSPTYTVVEPYQLDQQRIFHFDLYRIAAPGELAFIGIREYFAEQAICLVEWAERGEGYLPPADLHCTLTSYGNGRKAQFEARNELGEGILRSL